MKFDYFFLFYLLFFALIFDNPAFAQLPVVSAYVSSTSGPAGSITTQDKNSISFDKTNFVVRDIFQLKFGHYKDAISLIDDAMKLNFFPVGTTRVLTDFTGDAYRLILEGGYNSLSDYEKSLSSELNADQWKPWYEKFKTHVEASSREILRWVR
ncbi:MAG: hypothetical protein WBB12_10110 [Saprospiraceae bacterium]|jgi:hypothetical protein